MILCLFAAGLLAPAAFGQDPDFPPPLTLGVAWEGKSLMQDVLAEGLEEYLFTMAPQIEVTWRKALPSVTALGVAADRFQDSMTAMVLLRSSGATYLSLNPPIIPSFIGGCNHPVLLGAVTNIDRPGGMITGVTYAVPHEVMLKSFLAVLPDLDSILLIYEEGHPGGTIDRTGTREACGRLGLTYKEAGIRSRGGRNETISALRDSTSAIILINNGIVRDYAYEAVEAAGLTPVLAFSHELVREGALCALSVDHRKLGRMLGRSIVRVLVDGVPIGDLPVKMDDQPLLHINLDTAMALDVTVPVAVLRTAQIYRDDS